MKMYLMKETTVTNECGGMIGEIDVESSAKVFMKKEDATKALDERYVEIVEEEGFVDYDAYDGDEEEELTLTSDDIRVAKDYEDDLSLSINKAKTRATIEYDHYGEGTTWSLEVEQVEVEVK